MDLLKLCLSHFDTNNLYQVLGVDKNATKSQIKSAYRRKSLKVHPDRVYNETQKETAKEAFQVLTKVHIILTDDENRKIYDETGHVPDNDDFFSDYTTFDQFRQYWRTLFPKIDREKLDEFAEKYIGSDEEVEDLKRLYHRFHGDLDVIYEYHFYYDEDRVCEILKKLIKEKQLPPQSNFVNEPKSKKEKRLKRIEKERKMAAKQESKLNDDNGSFSLSKAILAKRMADSDSFLANLEAKYGSKSGAKKLAKNKKSRK